MNNAVNIGIRREDFVKRGFIGDVDIVVGRASAGQQFNAVDDLFRRVVLVVDNDNLVAGLDEGHGGERANIAGSTIVESEFLRLRESGRVVHIPSDEDRSDGHDYYSDWEMRDKAGLGERVLCSCSSSLSHVQYWFLQVQVQVRVRRSPGRLWRYFPWLWRTHSAPKSEV